MPQCDASSDALAGSSDSCSLAIIILHQPAETMPTQHGSIPYRTGMARRHHHYFAHTLRAECSVIRRYAHREYISLDTFSKEDQP